MSKLICPECGEEIKEGQLVCDNCNYHLLQPAAPAPSAQPTPAHAAPAQQPVKGGGNSVAMPESIMSHGNVAVNNSSAEDNSVHVTDNSQTVNNTNQTVNNNTTILIMGGTNAPLPAGMDENTAAAVRQAQQQIAQQQPAPQPKPQSQQPPQDEQKGIGSIAGGVAYTPPATSNSSKKWIAIIAAVLIIGGAAAYFIGGKKDTPAAAPAAQQTTVQPASTPAPAPAKQTTQSPATNKAKSTAATNETSAPQAATPVPKDANYEAGMKAYKEGDGLTAIQAFKASGSKESLRMLGKIYEQGCGSVEANAMMARKYYKEAEKK